MQKRNPACCLAGFLCLGLLVSLSTPCLGLETREMRAPKSRLVQAVDTDRDARNQGLMGKTLLGSARFFQKWISPIDGPRCSFSPTCSQFGYEAVHDHGPVLGRVCTAD